jgi:hypothetical protein
LCDSLLEINPDSSDRRLGTLTPLASVFMAREDGGGSLRHSARATRDLEKLSASERREVEEHLAKLKSSLCCSQHTDIKPHTELGLYPRGHNPWHLSGFTDAEHVHLCWLAEHAPYLRLIGQKARQRRDYPIEEFSDYSPPSEAVSPPELDKPYRQYTCLDLSAEFEKLKAKNQLLQTNEAVA